MGDIQLKAAADRIVFDAETALETLEQQENAIIGAAIQAAHLFGWSVFRRFELLERLEEQVRDVHGAERMALVETIHDGGHAEAHRASSKKQH